jgi:hypothetical protein
MSADDNPTEDDIQSEAELKEALDYYMLSETKPPPSSEKVTNQAIKIMNGLGMLNKNMSPEEVEELTKQVTEILNRLKGGSRTRSRSKKSKRRRNKSSRKKRSTRQRR